jgi:hypothetical protein
VYWAENSKIVQSFGYRAGGTCNMLPIQSRGGESPRSQSQPLPAYAIYLLSRSVHHSRSGATLHWSTVLVFVPERGPCVGIHLQCSLFIGGNEYARGHDHFIRVSRHCYSEQKAISQEMACSWNGCVALHWSILATGYVVGRLSSQQHGRQAWVGALRSSCSKRDCCECALRSM